MELTFKFIIDKVHPKKDSTLPVRLRFYQDRGYKEFSLGFSVLESEWNDQLQQVMPKNENHLAFNTKISSLKSKIQKFLLFNEDSEAMITPEEIIRHISQKETKKLITKPDIFIYGKEHIAKLQGSGNIGNSIAYSCAINKLKSFAKADKLPFEAITFKFLEDFNSSMLAEGIKVNSISLYLRSIRALFNKAIKDGTLEAKYYPFSSFRIRNEKTICRALSKQEMAKIAALKLPVNSPIFGINETFFYSPTVL